MRVRISYGMEIEDIPEKAAEIGYDALYALRSAADRLEKAISNVEESGEDHSLVLSMLEKVRLNLNKTDLIITDLQAILSGLNNYHIGEQNVSEGRSTVDPSGDLATTTTDSGKG